MTDLDKLIAAVDAGVWPVGNPCFTLIDLRDWMQAGQAFDGSIDAAKRLHDGLVPEWTAVELRSRNGRKRWVAELSMMEGDQQIYAVGYNPDPARAWLLAILEALKDGVAKPLPQPPEVTP